MCHVLSEGSKWSGLGRPCGLFPCAPRYYYSTPRCPIVYGLVLSSACCASVWCCAPVLWCALCLACPVLWCVCVVLWLWCVGASCPCSPCPLWVCATVLPCILVLFLSFFRGIIPALYMGCYRRVLYAPYIRALFFRLAIYDPFCTHSKSRPLDSECGFQKSA